MLYIHTHIYVCLFVSPSQWKETTQTCELTKVYVLREPINIHVVKREEKVWQRIIFKRDNGDHSPS